MNNKKDCTKLLLKVVENEINKSSGSADENFETEFLATMDEIAGEVIILNYAEWEHNFYHRTGIAFSDHYNRVTKEQAFETNVPNKKISKDKTHWKEWELKMVYTIDTLTGEITYRLKIKGNPSAMYFGGKNYRNIPLSAFANILRDLSDNLAIDLQDISIKPPTEPSLTICIKGIIADHELKGRLVKYRGKSFVEMKNSDKMFMGYEIESNHEYPKIYLTGQKFREELNELRIEGHFKKIASFKHKTNIQTFADYLNPDKMISCLYVVRNIWDDVITFDPVLKVNPKYPGYINAMILKGGNPTYWGEEFKKSASPKTLPVRIKKYREISAIDGDAFHYKIQVAIKLLIKKLTFLSSMLSGQNREYIDIQDIKVNISDIEDKGDITLTGTGASELKNDFKNITIMVEKSKKQVNRDNLKKRNDQYNRFMNELKHTLARLEYKSLLSMTVGQAGKLAA